MDTPGADRLHDAAIAFGTAAVVVFTLNQGVAVELAGIGGMCELVANRIERTASRVHRRVTTTIGEISKELVAPAWLFHSDVMPRLRSRDYPTARGNH